MSIFARYQILGKLKGWQEEEILEEPGSTEESTTGQLSIFSLAILLIIGGIFIGRLVFLQITQGYVFRYLAEGNRLRLRDIPASRGLIIDAQGELLVKNNLSYDLVINPPDLPNNQDEQKMIEQKLSALSFQVDLQTLKKDFSHPEPLVIKSDLSREEMITLKIATADLLGIAVKPRIIRQYLNEPGLSHLLGYIGKISQKELKKRGYKMTNLTGKTGLEAVYENELKGIDGAEKIEVDSHGQLQRILGRIEPQSGRTLRLWLDMGLQRQAVQTIQDYEKAVVVALNPQTGGVLAMVSLPSFDNNIFSRSQFNEDYQELLQDKNQPLVNRAISGVYPSGSIIKPVIAAAGLQERVISESTTINDPGELTIGEWVFPDWKNHGLVDVKKAIAESCNVFFYAVAGGWDKIRGLGIRKIDEYLEKFGFGAETGIDLPTESAGLVPSPEWKEKNKQEKWYQGDSYHLGIGQGDFLVTPLQIAQAMSVVANDGKLIVPHLTKTIEAGDGSVKTLPEKTIREKFINPAALRTVREGMRQAVTDGSARQLADLQDKNGQPVAAAGKTGTAQFGNEDKTHSWFIGFAPYDEPQILVVVLIEGGGEGYAAAEPAAKNILDWWLKNRY